MGRWLPLLSVWGIVFIDLGWVEEIYVVFQSSPHAGSLGEPTQRSNRPTSGKYAKLPDLGKDWDSMTRKGLVRQERSIFYF